MSYHFESEMFLLEPENIYSYHGHNKLHAMENMSIVQTYMYRIDVNNLYKNFLFFGEECSMRVKKKAYRRNK